jgi:hypothetical protein
LLTRQLAIQCIYGGAKDLPDEGHGHEGEPCLRDNGNHARPVKDRRLPLRVHVSFPEVVDDEREGMHQRQRKHHPAHPSVEDHQLVVADPRQQRDRILLGAQYEDKRQARNAHPARPRCKRWAVAEGQRLCVGPAVGLWTQCHGEEEDDTCGTEEEDAEGGREPVEKVDFPGLVGEVAEAGLGAAVEGRALQGSRGEEREGGGEGKEDDGRHQEGDREEAKAVVGFIPGRG